MSIDRPIGISEMLDAAKEAVFLARNRQKIELQRHQMLAIFMVECLQIIAEAATGIPKELKGELSTIPWQKIVNIRVYLNQTKLDINMDIIWEIVTKDLPVWINQLDRLLANQSKLISE